MKERNSSNHLPRARTARYEGIKAAPKIELHVHLEGTVGPRRLTQLARRNDVQISPSATTDDGFVFQDFRHFIQTYAECVRCLRTRKDFVQITLDYAREAAAHGAVYIEGIFGPINSVREGANWDEVFAGYCDGAQQTREETGVTLNLTPDIGREFSMEEARMVVEYALKYRERGIVGVGLGGLEADHPAETFASLFEVVHKEGLASLPHAGEAAGPASVRAALDSLYADRVRHGVRALEDPVLVGELRDRGIVLDVCITSNVCTRVVPTLVTHPLPRLIGAGVRCSLSTDDPALFGTNLSTEYERAAVLGVKLEDLYQAALHGAICSDATRCSLTEVGALFDWAAVDLAPS